MHGLKAISATAGALVAVGAILALSTPIVETAVSYGAFSMSVDGGVFGGAAVQYDDPTFDGKHGNALRSIGPLLVLGAVAGVAAIVLVFLPRVWGAIAGSLVATGAALAAGGALGAALYGSRFADGADSAADLGVGGWGLAVGASLGLLLSLIALLPTPVAALKERRDGVPARSSDAEHAPAEAPPARPPPVPTVILPRQLVAAGGVVIAAVLAIVLATGRVGVQRAQVGGNDLEYYLWGSRYAQGRTWYHTDPGSVALLAALVFLSLAVLGALLWIAALALAAMEGPRPRLQTAGAILACGGCLAGFSLVLSGAITIHGLPGGGAGTAIGLAVVGLTVTLATWAPTVVGLARPAADAAI